MRSLKLSLAFRTMYNRSLIRLRLPRASEVVHPSRYKTGIYSTTNSLRFYCSNASANTANSTVSSQENRATFEPPIYIAEIPNLTDDDLFEIISQLRDFYGPVSRRELKHSSQTPFVKAIDEECIQRGRRKWSLDQIVEVLDMFHPKGYFLCPNLLIWSLRTKFVKAMKSPIPTMMKYVAVIEKHKFWKKLALRCYCIEFTLIKKLDEFTLPEISTLLHVLNTRMVTIASQELLANLYDRLIAGIDQLDLRILDTFVIFFTNQPTNINFTQLIDHLLVRLPDSHFSLAENTASFCCRKKIDNPKILDLLAVHLLNRFPNVNITELETIVQTLVFFNYNSNNFYQQVIDNFKVEPLRSTLIEHPKRLSRIIGNLCLINVYPYDYVDRVLSKEFLQKTFGKKLSHHNVLREIMILDGCIKAECPDYQGNKLDASLEENLCSRWSSHIHHYLETEGDTVITRKSMADDKVNYKPTSHNEAILDARRILRSIFGGPEYLHTCYVLPFLPRPDLLFCLDGEKHAVKLPDQILNCIRVDYRNLDKCVDWYVVLSIGLHSAAKDENVLIYGKDIAKERILNKLGFNVIKILPKVWFEWPEERKRDYLSESMR